MKIHGFVLICAVTLALGACNRGNEDVVENAELNQPSAEDLNAMANQAAMDAANAEAAALGNIQEAQNEATEDTSNPTDADEQNVSGM